MQTSDKPISDPLLPEELAAVWQSSIHDVVANIPRFIRRMGLPKSPHRRGAEMISEAWGLASNREVKLALLADLDLHTRILERVRIDFHKAVTNRTVDRKHVGGWLNRTTQRKTWKLATPRARYFLLELPSYCAGSDELANIGTTEYSPDEMLALREVAERYATAVATLSAQDKQLLDAKMAGKGYETLAVARGKSTNAIKTEASRLWKEIEAAVRGKNSNFLDVNRMGDEDCA